MDETEVNEVVEYRIRFRAPNKPNTDKLGVGVYHDVEEGVFAGEFFASFMDDVRATGSVSKEHSLLSPTMATLRQLYSKCFRILLDYVVLYTYR
jgi:hypothetical protein